MMMTKAAKADFAKTMAWWSASFTYSSQHEQDRNTAYHV
jgi:hypothetical protein